MASKRSRGKGRAVRMVDGPVMPAAPPAAEVVADVVANAFSSVDLVMRVLVRLPFLLGVAGPWLASRASSAWAWERTLRRLL